MARQRNSVRSNDPEGMRNRVLDVAAVAFQTTGYGATSMHDIVRAAGVTGGALYHHFPSKKMLAISVIRERVAREIGATWLAAVREASDARSGILSVFETVIAALDDAGRVQGCPLNNLALELSLADPDFAAAVTVEYDAWRDAIALRLVQEEAPYAPDPRAFATVVVALFSGAMAIAKAEQRTDALRACAAQLERMMTIGG